MLPIITEWLNVEQVQEDSERKGVTNVQEVSGEMSDPYVQLMILM